MTTKEEGAQAAADRIKAQALSAAKGLSRVQAERAAAAAARNVNAYGQKEEGPSRWQERKEAKRQMYLMSTEKKVTLGVRKDLLKPASGVQGAAQQCQKCFQSGHWTYECKNERVYMSRPSRSQQLRNPQLKPKFLAPSELDYLKNDANAGNPDANGNAASKHKRKKKKMASDDSSSSMSSDDSDSSSEYSSTEESSSTDSDEERRRRRRRRHRRRSLSSSSDSYSDSESEKDTRSRKVKRHRRSASSSETDSDSEEERKSRRRKKHRRHSSPQSSEESPIDSEEGKRRQRKKKKNGRHSPSLSSQESLTSASTDQSESSDSEKETRNRGHEKHASAKTKKHRT